jgi:scyllo-inositol 2-dehydrogenase (NADP+)
MDKVLLLTGGLYHDFARNEALISRLLTDTGRFSVTVVDSPAALTAASLGAYRAVLLLSNKDLSAEEAGSLAAYVRAGHGLLVLHCGVPHDTGPAAYADLVGLIFVDHGPVFDFAVTIDDPQHDVSCRTPDFRITDELYITEPRGEPMRTLASAHWHGRRVPVLAVKSEGQGRVVYFGLGHDAAAIGHRDFRQLLVHGLDWAVGRDETRQVGVGLVGYGPAFKMGKHHGERIQATRGLSLVAACDKDPKCLETAKADFPGIATCDSVDDLLKNDAVELAVIILPHHLHAPVALQCLKAGRHVVLEKPFCLTSAEATAMIEAARDKDLTLTVYHNRRFDGDFLTIRRAIEADLIGEVFQVQVSWCNYDEPGTWWRSSKEISGGLLYDWGAHLIDWLLHFLPGQVESVTGFLHKRRWWGTTNEDHGLALLRFEGGRTGSLEMSNIARHNPFRWRILGTKGAIVSQDSKTIQLITEIDGQTGPMQLTVHPGEHVRWYHNLAEHLLRGAPLVVRPEEARRVIGILQTAEKSSRSGQAEPVPFEGDFALTMSV